MRRAITLAGLLIGCGGDPGGDPDGGAACAADELAYAHVVRSAGEGDALAGVEVCVPTHPAIPCGTTAADGSITVCLPASTDVAVSYELADFMPLLLGVNFGTAPPTVARFTSVGLHPLASACESWDPLGVTCPPTDEGVVWLRTQENFPDLNGWPPGLGDVSVSYTPAPSTGTFYMTSSFTHDADATATTASANSVFAGGFAAGDQLEVTISHATLTGCGAYDSFWAGSTPGTVRVPIRAGFRTFTEVTCGDAN